LTHYRLVAEVTHDPGVQGADQDNQQECTQENPSKFDVCWCCVVHSQVNVPAVAVANEVGVNLNPVNVIRIFDKAHSRLDGRVSDELIVIYMRRTASLTRGQVYSFLVVNAKGLHPESNNLVLSVFGGVSNVEVEMIV
jgi:hypothetical protein